MNVPWETTDAHVGDLHHAGAGWVTAVGRPRTRLDVELHSPAWRPMAGYEPRNFADYSDTVYGLGCPYNTPDRRGSTINREMFAADDGLEVPVLVDHDSARHVGWARLESRRDGLHFVGQLRRGARDAIGNRRGMSVGFAATEPVGRRYFVGRVCELSIVDANRAAYPTCFIRLAHDRAA